MAPSTQERLRKLVARSAHPHSEEQYDACADRCRDHDHPLFGPYLQYKKDDFHLGRWYILCRGTHPGDPRLPRRTFKYISQALSAAQRRSIRTWAVTHGVTLASATGATFKVNHNFIPSNNNNNEVPVTSAASTVIDLTTSPSPTPSVEITGHVSAPDLNDFLVVYFFSENNTEPKTFKLPAYVFAAEFRFCEYVDALHKVELKQSERLSILTFGASGFEMWSNFTVADLAIPRRIPAIVVSRLAVQHFHESISALYDHAYPDAAKLPGRIPDEVEDV